MPFAPASYTEIMRQR